MWCVGRGVYWLSVSIYGQQIVATNMPHICIIRIRMYTNGYRISKQVHLMMLKTNSKRGSSLINRSICINCIQCLSIVVFVVDSCDVKLQQCSPNNNKETKKKKKGLQRELESCGAIASKGASEREELCCGCVARLFIIILIMPLLCTLHFDCC